MTLHRVDRPETLAALFRRDPEIHLYGLADLEEPFWSKSTWYREGEAAVGLISVGDDWTAGYAMTSGHKTATLDLLVSVQHRLPLNTWITGPPGLADRLGAVRSINDQGTHVRMILGTGAKLPEATRASPLALDDVAAVAELHRSAPGPAFFLPSMLETGYFVGIWDGDRLIASAGTHAASATYGVAAIGAVITHPEFRGQGLGTEVTAAVTHRLRLDHPTIGLNVKETNTSARRLYERLGFRTFTRYEEIELL